MTKKSNKRATRNSSRQSAEQMVTSVDFHDYDPVQLAASVGLDLLALSAISPSLGLGAISDRISLMVENFRFWRIRNLRVRGWFSASSGQPSTGVPTGILQYQPYVATVPTAVARTEVRHSVVVPGHSIATSGGAEWQPSDWLRLGPADFDTPTRWRLTDDDGAGIQNGYGDIDLVSTGDAYSTGVYCVLEWMGTVEFKQPVQPDTIALAATVESIIKMLRQRRMLTDKQPQYPLCRRSVPSRRAYRPLLGREDTDVLSPDAECPAPLAGLTPNMANPAVECLFDRIRALCSEPPGTAGEPSSTK